MKCAVEALKSGFGSYFTSLFINFEAGKKMRRNSVENLTKLLRNFNF